VLLQTRVIDLHCCHLQCVNGYFLTPLSFKLEPSQSKSADMKTEFDIKWPLTVILGHSLLTSPSQGTATNIHIFLETSHWPNLLPLTALVYFQLYFVVVSKLDVFAAIGRSRWSKVDDFGAIKKRINYATLYE